jgi:hypothetical protein
MKWLLPESVVGALAGFGLGFMVSFNLGYLGWVAIGFGILGHSSAMWLAHTSTRPIAGQGLLLSGAPRWHSFSASSLFSLDSLALSS